MGLKSILHKIKVTSEEHKGFYGVDAYLNFHGPIEGLDQVGGRRNEQIKNMVKSKG